MRSTDTAPAFLTENPSLMSCVSRVTWSTVPCYCAFLLFAIMYISALQPFGHCGTLGILLSWMHALAKLPRLLKNFALESGQTSTARFTSRFASMWLACSACFSTAVKLGQHTDTREKGSTRYIFAACDPSSVSLRVTVYHILPF